MSWPINIIIGNGISAIAAIFLILSCIVNDRESAYKYQSLEAFTLAFSSIFFYSWTGLTTLILAGVRNYIVMKDRFTLKLTVIFTILAIVLGLSVNTLGFIGLLPIIAMVQITLCNYFFKTMPLIKLSFLINVLIYAIYAFAIFDIVSGVVQVVTAIISFVSLIKLLKQE